MEVSKIKAEFHATKPFNNLPVQASKLIKLIFSALTLPPEFVFPEQMFLLITAFMYAVFWIIRNDTINQMEGNSVQRENKQSIKIVTQPVIR